MASIFPQPQCVKSSFDFAEVSAHLNHINYEHVSRVKYNRDIKR